MSRLYAALTIFTVLLCGSALADDTTSRPKLVDQALQVALVPELLAASSREMHERLDQDRRVASLNSEQREQLLRFMEPVFDPKTQYEDVAQSLVLQYDVNDFAAFVEAYSRPVAKKINTFMIEAYQPGHVQALQDYAASLEKNPPADTRIQMLAQLDDLTGSSEIGAEMGLAMMSRIGGIAPTDPRYEQLRAKVLVNSREQVLLTSLQSLKNASDEEIGQYVGLHELPPVARVSKLIARAFANNMQRSIERMMERMVDLALEDKIGARHPAVAVSPKPVTGAK